MNRVEQRKVVNENKIQVDVILDDRIYATASVRMRNRKVKNRTVNANTH